MNTSDKFFYRREDGTEVPFSFDVFRIPDHNKAFGIVKVGNVAAGIFPSKNDMDTIEDVFKQITFSQPVTVPVLFFPDGIDVKFWDLSKCEKAFVSLVESDIVRVTDEGRTQMESDIQMLLSKIVPEVVVKFFKSSVSNAELKDDSTRNLETTPSPPTT